MRSRIWEDVGNILKAAALQEPFSPTLARWLELGRKVSRADVERVFAKELDAVPDDVRAARLAVVDTLAGTGAWEQLRRSSDLGVPAARKATVGCDHLGVRGDAMIRNPNPTNRGSGHAVTDVLERGGGRNGRTGRRSCPLSRSPSGSSSRLVLWFTEPGYRAEQLIGLVACVALVLFDRNAEQRMAWLTFAVPALVLIDVSDVFWSPTLGIVVQGALDRIAHRAVRRRHRARLPRQPHRQLRAGRPRRGAGDLRDPAARKGRAGRQHRTG